MATREEGEEGDELDAFHGSRWICRSLRRGEVEEKGGKVNGEFERVERAINSPGGPITS